MHFLCVSVFVDVLVISEYFSLQKMSACIDKHLIRRRRGELSAVFPLLVDLETVDSYIFVFKLKKRPLCKFLSCSIFTRRPCGEKNSIIYEPKFQST